MDYEKCVFPVLCILTRLPANKLPRKGLPHGFALQFQNLSAASKQRCAEALSVREGGVLIISPTISSNSILC